jgi:hypothetical protein
LIASSSNVRPTVRTRSARPRHGMQARKNVEATLPANLNFKSLNGTFWNVLGSERGMDIEENWQTPSFATMRSSVRSRLAPPIFQSLRATPNPESVPFCSNNKYQACRGKLPHRFSGLHRHHPAHTHFYRHSLNVSALRRRSCIGVHWAPGPLLRTEETNRNHDMCFGR